jgi:large subunit ribosomal protein L7/L12
MYSLLGDQALGGTDFLYRGSPAECLNSATSYLAGQGYEIEMRSETQVSMSRHSLTSGMGWLLFIMSLFTFGLALLALLALYLIKRRVTVVAVPAEEDSSRVTVTWSNEVAKKALDAWIAEELGTRARAWEHSSGAAPVPAREVQGNYAVIQGNYAVILEDTSAMNSNQKIRVIKVVRAATDLGLKESKKLVDEAPNIVKDGLSKEAAESLKAKLEEAGSTATIRA